MDPTQSTITAISQVTDLAKPVVKLACDFAEGLLGEPLRVAGSLLADPFYAWQTRNRIRILEKTRKFAEQHDIDPRCLATGFLMHAIEASGNVEDDELQELWVRLLAGAMEDESAQAALHVETLRRLSRDDAVALAAMTDEVRRAWWSRPVDVRLDDNLHSTWPNLRWRADRPPTEEIAESWSKVLSRLEAVSIIERDSVHAMRDIAGSLREYFNKSRNRKQHSAGVVGHHDIFESMDLSRLTNSLSKSAKRTETWLITPYGLDILHALGMTEIGEPLAETAASTL